jgi:hypothetical protein
MSPRHDSYWENFNLFEKGFKNIYDSNSCNNLVVTDSLTSEVCGSTLYDSPEIFKFLGGGEWKNTLFQNHEPSLWKDIKVPFNKIIVRLFQAEYSIGWFGLLLLNNISIKKDFSYTLLALNYPLDDKSIKRHDKLFESGIPISALTLGVRQQDESPLYPIFITWRNSFSEDSMPEKLSYEPIIRIDTVFRFPRCPSNEDGLIDWREIKIDEFSVSGENINEEFNALKTIYSRSRNYLKCFNDLDECTNEKIKKKICWMIAHSAFACETKRNSADYCENDSLYKEIKSFVISCVPGSNSQGSPIAIVLTSDSITSKNSRKFVEQIICISRTLASPYEFISLTLENQVQTIGKIAHQMPKDIGYHNDQLMEYKLEMQMVKNQYPELDFPDVPSLNSFSVTMMFLSAYTDKKLYQLPKQCAKILNEEWNEKSIGEFINMVVWQQSFERILASQDKLEKENMSLAGYFNNQLELLKEYPKPKLIIKNSFKPIKANGIYPLVLIALRNSFQHSYIGSLISNIPGEVEIKYINEFNAVQILNTGKPQQSVITQSQKGLERDISLFENLCFGWNITDFGDSYFSRFDHGISKWITEIKDLNI